MTGSASAGQFADSEAASPLADTVLHISPSTLAPDLRYIKHLKLRNAALEYDAAQVLTCHITREADQPISPNSSFIDPNSAFLHLSFLGLTRGG